MPSVRRVGWEKPKFLVFFPRITVVVVAVVAESVAAVEGVMVNVERGSADDAA